MGFFDRISAGLNRSRDRFKEQMNVLLKRGPEVNEDFWETLEETLILSDIGAQAAFEIVENLRDQATRKALPDAYAVLDLLVDTVADTFTEAEVNIFEEFPQIVMFVGVNGSGKTTTVGKIAAANNKAGKRVLIGGADTFRAAAMEQLEVWAQRADVEIVTRDRGSDPASVCYETIERSEELDSELVLIDTSGRLHTSNDLMRELQKVVSVVRKRAHVPVQTVLVIDSTTGQNGLQQAREFNKALELDGIIMTKLDGTAKGGIALAVSHELGLPIFKIGVGEGVEDLQDFDAHDFARALIGDFAESENIDVDELGSDEVVEDSEEETVQESSQEIEETSAQDAETEEEPVEAEDVAAGEETVQVEESVEEASEEPVAEESVEEAEETPAESETEAEKAPEKAPEKEKEQPVEDNSMKSRFKRFFLG